MNQSLYDLPQGWKWEKLGNLCEITGGGTPSRKITEYFTGDIPWVTPTDLTRLNKLEITDTSTYITQEAINNSSTRLLPSGCVLLTSRATVGVTAINTVPMCTNQGFANFQCSLALNNYYLAYYFPYIKEKLLNLSGGSIYKEINKTTLKNLKIPLPPLPVQERIVEILQKADEIRRKRQEALAIADSILPAIFNDMFGISEVKSRNYKTVKLKDVCTIISGGTPSKKNPEFWTNGTIPWVSPKDMKVSEIYDVPDKVTEKALASRSPVKAGTILIVVRGMILQHSVPVGLVQNSLTFNQDIKGLISNDGIPSEFIFWTLKCAEKRLLELVDTASHGTKKIDTDRLMNFEIVLADDKAMRYFAKTHRRFFDSAKNQPQTKKRQNLFRT